MSCPGYNGKKLPHHDYRLFGFGDMNDGVIRCDIVCSECGKVRCILIKKDSEAFENILKDEDRKFRIPKSIYVGEEKI